MCQLAAHSTDHDIFIVDTGFRPYQCKECQRAFSRQDSLARHERLHTRKNSHHYPSPPSPSSSLISHSSLTTALSPLGVDIVNGNSPTTKAASGGTQDYVPVSYEEQNSPMTSIHNVPQSADLDVDLIWPDSEDLFESLTASENTNQWQMPFTTLPITSHALQVNNSAIGIPNTFRDKVPSIGNIPTGESHRAVHNVSEMATTLVSGRQYQYMKISSLTALLVFIRHSGR
jgi:hypothetical protein